MQRGLRIVGTAWAFLWSSPVLPWAVAWLLVLPLAGIASTVAGFGYITLLFNSLPTSADYGRYALVLLCTLLPLSILFCWGVSAVLVASRRLLQSKSGRSRSSFAGLLSDAWPWAIPTLVLLVVCTAELLLWALPLLLLAVFWAERQGAAPLLTNDPQIQAFLDQPVLVGAVALALVLLIARQKMLRTFSPMLLVCGELSIAQALQKSSAFAQSHMRSAAGVVVGMKPVVVLPILLLLAVVATALWGQSTLVFMAIICICVGLFGGFGLGVLLIGLTEAYGLLQKESARKPRQVTPPMERVATTKSKTRR